jgi:HK97 family phage major capsid protein
MSTKTLDSLASVSARIRELSARTDAESRTERGRLTDEVRRIASELPTSQRKGEFAVDDCDGGDFGDTLRAAGERGGAVAQLAALHDMRSDRDEVRDVQRACDELYILGTLLKVDPRKTRHFARVRGELPAFRRAFDTGSAGDWIPEGFSPDMVAKVRLSLKVAALFDRIECPTATYHVPVEGADGVAYYVPEQADVDADVDSGRRIPSTLESPGLVNGTFHAKKLASRVTTSSEVTEETIVPMLPYLRAKLVRAMATAQEEGAINGSTASPHPDADTTAATDRRRAFDGIRSHCIRSTMLNGATIVSTSTPGTLQVSDIRSLRLKLAKFAVTPSECVIVTGPLGYNALLGLKDGDTRVTTTYDKLGPAATLITGQVASLDGWPVVLSEHVREDLNASGLYDGVTTDSTLVLLVNTKTFAWGDYRKPTLKFKDLPEVDQVMLIATQRLDFLGWFPTSPTAGYIRNVKQ